MSREHRSARGIAAGVGLIIGMLIGLFFGSTVGAVIGAHGTKGEVRVKTFTLKPEDLGAYGPLSTDDGRNLSIAALRAGKPGEVVVRFQEIADRNAAEALKGRQLSVPRAALPAPEADEFYHADLVGLAVEDKDQAPIGRVRGLHNFGAGDVMEIETLAGATEFIPFNSDVVLGTRFARKLQPGLLHVVGIEMQIAERMDKLAGATVTTALAPGSSAPIASALRTWARVGRTDRLADSTASITARWQDGELFVVMNTGLGGYKPAAPAQPAALQPSRSAAVSALPPGTSTVPVRAHRGNRTGAIDRDGSTRSRAGAARGPDQRVRPAAAAGHPRPGQDPVVARALRDARDAAVGTDEMSQFHRALGGRIVLGAEVQQKAVQRLDPGVLLAGIFGRPVAAPLAARGVDLDLGDGLACLVDHAQSEIIFTISSWWLDLEAYSLNFSIEWLILAFTRFHLDGCRVVCSRGPDIFADRLAFQLIWQTSRTIQHHAAI